MGVSSGMKMAEILAGKTLDHVYNGRAGSARCIEESWPVAAYLAATEQ